MVVVSSCRGDADWSRNERNPLLLVASIKLGTLVRLPVTNRRKVGTTSDHHAPYRPKQQCATNFADFRKNESRTREGKQIS